MLPLVDISKIVDQPVNIAVALSRTYESEKIRRENW